MASDIFIKWKDKKPTRQEVEKVITQFFGPVATQVKWKKDRFFVDLIGNNFHPLSGIDGAYVRDMGDERVGRWIEVWMDSKTMDIMTRNADEFTNCCATGLSKLFARFWQGTLDD